ncbi:MAG TPA: hypothetical protein VKR79_08650 [Gaiellaceae bacterium]|nr:hypothetical protein [Gaiellaceae bacterium]
MKRLLGIGVVALLTACGSSHTIGSYAIDYRPHVPRSSVTPLANQRERQAEREAQKLLDRIPLPPGAVRFTGALARSDRLNQAGLGVSIVAMTADRYSLWIVPGSGKDVIAFEKRYVPADLRRSGLGSSPDGWAGETFDAPTVNGSPQQAVTVVVEPNDGGTLFRLDAGVSWVYPRSPSEVVPAGVRTIDIQGGGVAVHVTDPAKVARIVRWFDALKVYQPGPFVSCFATIAARVSFSFLSRSGRMLASAVVPAAQATNCDTILFTIGGTPQDSLIDARSGKDGFAGRVQHLLGVRFTPRR